ncbi:MAG: aldo/keto reductase [Gemmatimonadota bacterium]|nr:aldo/keto reductase [Gemmatimonadota bacterium]
MLEKNPSTRKTIKRRDFLKFGAAGAVLTGAACSGSPSSKQQAATPKEALVPKKRLGRTAMTASILAMGGGSSLSMVKDDQQALALIDLARRKGVNFFDTGAGYGAGQSERRFGEALEPYRKSVYLATKYGPGDGYDKLMEKIERSLKRFRSDYLDLAQMHGLQSLKNVDRMFDAGTLENLVKLKEQGVVRYIGFSSHGSPKASAEALRRFDFDVALLAANASKLVTEFEFDPRGRGSFEDECFPIAREKNVGVFTFKVTGQRRLIARNNELDKATGEDLLRYGFSLPIHGMVLGMHTVEHVESAARLAAGFKPMTREEMDDLNGRLTYFADDLTLDYLRPDYVDNGGYRAHLA